MFPASDDGFDLMRGSGNVFRDLGLLNPELEQLRSVLIARVIKALGQPHPRAVPE